MDGHYFNGNFNPNPTSGVNPQDHNQNEHPKTTQLNPSNFAATQYAMNPNQFNHQNINNQNNLSSNPPALNQNGLGFYPGLGQPSQINFPQPHQHQILSQNIAQSQFPSQNQFQSLPQSSIQNQFHGQASSQPSFTNQFQPQLNNNQYQNSQDNQSIKTDTSLNQDPGLVSSANSSQPPSNIVLSQDQLKQIFNKLTELKKQGAHQNNDPEYQKLMDFLRSYSQSRANSTAQANMKMKQNKEIEQTQTPPNQVAVPQTIPKPNSQVPPKNPLNPSQISEISRQVQAYRYLSKNLPVPAAFNNAKIANTPESKPEPPKQELLQDSSSDPLALKIMATAVQKHIADSSEAEKIYENSNDSILLGFLSPYKILNDPRSRSSKVLIPSIVPKGLDPQTIARERDDRLKSRIYHRIKELEKVPNTLANQSLSYNLENSSDGETSHSSKLKALIELKSLRLLGLQKKLREEVLKTVSQSSTIISSTDRNSFRRLKRQTLKEARHTEKLERQQRIEREKRERQKHTDFLASIVQHGKDLQQWHKNQQTRQAKIGKMVLQYHNQVEKDEQRRIERLQKHRLELLKTGNESEYLKLIDQTKDTRIKLLLQQTDGFLKSLSQSVIQQQNDHTYYETTQESVSLPTAPISDIHEDNNDDYYSVAHRIKEEITRQPNILVGGTLKEYQLKGLQWMVSLYNNRLNGILADEMGLGKTIQTISLITHLIEVKKQNGPYLVLVPLSTIPNWTQEFSKWAPSISKVVYKGTPTERKDLQKSHIKHENFQVLLTTFEYIIRDKSALSKIKWLHMVIDEGHRMKNAESKLSVTLNTHYSVKYRLILTGTPLQNNLPELWALLNFVLPRVFNSVKTFDEWFNTPFNNSGAQDKVELNEEEQLLIIKRLHKVLRPFLLRRLKKDVEADLPDKVEKVIKCKMSALQHKIYHRIQKREAVLAPTGNTKSHKIRGLNNTVMQLRKACNHPFVFPGVEDEINPVKHVEDNLYRVSGKVELLDRILPKLFATGHRVLMFFQMTAIMNIFQDYLRYRGIRYLRLDGQINQEQRANDLKKFNASDSPYNLFILSTRAGGLGLNLQTADTVIIFDSDWNPHQDLQAQDRAHRIGQKNKVLILRLITANSVEEKILERAQFKLDIDGKVIQAGKFDNKSTAEEREALLRSLLEGVTEETTGADEDLNDDDMNILIARTEEEIQIFTKMDEERVETELREWRALGKKGPIPSRLIQEHELPESLTKEIAEIPEEDPEVLGRGRRTKDEVVYDDGLTEEQYLEAVENEEDIGELIMKKKRQRIRREERRQQQEITNSPGSSTSNPKKSEVSSDTPRKKKRLSNRSSDSSPIPSKKNKAENILPMHVRQSLNQRFLKCVAAMEELRDKKDSRRKICYLFEKLPSKREYPDYYLQIKSPISIKEIRQKINQNRYHVAKELFSDCLLMFQNAREYNVEGSLVYNDAGLMENAFKTAFEENFPQDEGHIKRLKPILNHPSSEIDQDSNNDLDNRLEVNDTSDTSSISSSTWSRLPKNYIDADSDSSV